MSINMFIALLQFLGTAFFIYNIIVLNKVIKFKITIHNFPIICFCIIGLVGAILLSYYHFLWYIPSGIILGMVSNMLLSQEIPNFPKIGTAERMFIVCFCSIFWAHFIILFIFSKPTLKLNE